MITKTTHLLLLSLFCIGFSISLLGKSLQTKAVLGDTLKPINIIQTLHYTAGQANPKIQLQASRGRKFHWSNGATTSSILVKGGVSGDYSVQIEEENGLLWQLSTSVSSTEKLRVKNPPSNGQQLDQTNSISAVAQAPDCGTVGLGGYYNKICAGTSLTLIASGGDSYLWSTNATTSSITVTPADGQEFSVKISRTSPTTGEVVCETTRTTGPIQVIPKPVAAITVSNNACSVIGTTLTASGGETYSWSNGATTASIVTQEAVPYSVTVSNGGGFCSDAESVSLTTNFNPQVNGASSICKGAGAQLTASGGGTYQWNNGAIASRITVLPTSVGTYTYTVTITNGSCSAVKSHTLIVNAAPSAIITGPSAACKNNSFSLSASGGGTYSWSTGQNTASISVTGIQSTQNYSVTVTGSNGCQSTASQQVGVLPAPTLDGPSNVCSGSPANLVVAGGATYRWSTGETSSSIVAFPTGTSQYNVTVTDANNCIYVLNKTLSVENPPSANINGVNTICSGQSTTLSVFGGATYAWSTGASTASITVNPLQNTTYTVTVSSASGCSAIGSKVVTVKPLPNGSISGASSICPGQSTSISASGGGTYVWNTGASTATVVVSPTQNTTYTVSISNAQGCTVVLNHLVSAGLTGTASNDGPLTCTKTSVTLQGNSSATGATYQWKNAEGTVIANAATTSVSSAGSYTLVISVPGACTSTITTQVSTDFTVPSATASNNGPITCALPNVTLSATPNTPGQLYQWKNSTGTVLATTANVSVNQVGTYSLVVTGSNGCASQSTTTVSSNLVLPTVSVSNDGPLTCTKGSVTLSASSSNSGINYVWKNGSNVTIGSNSSVGVSTAGTYTLEAFGSNGCKVTAYTTVASTSTLPNISVSNTGPISCTNEYSTVQGNSTTTGATFEWRNPNNRLVSTQKNYTSNIAGTYTFKVTAPSGCTNTASTIVGTTGSVPQSTYVNNTGPLTCVTTSVTLKSGTSTSNVSYQWRDSTGTQFAFWSYPEVTAPGPYTVKIIDASGCAISLETVVSINNPIANLGADQTICNGTSTILNPNVIKGKKPYTYFWSTGATSSTLQVSPTTETTYTVTVTDNRGCKSIDQVVIRLHAKPNANAGSNKTICAGSSINLSGTASGGTAPYTYAWTGGSTTSTTSVNPSTTTTYTLTVTDNKGCQGTNTAVVNVKPLPSLSLSGDNQSFCGSGIASIGVNVLSGTAPFVYSWSNGATSTGISIAASASGGFSVLVRDKNGCTASASGSFTVIPIPQPQILGGDINCYGNSTTLTATGGSSFVWSTGETTASITLNQPTQTKTYTVTVSNSPNCSATAQKTVVVPTALSLTAQIQNDQDCIAGNVQVVANGTGGQGASRYQLDNGAFQSLPTFLNVSNGLHTLGVQDVMGCSASANVTIAELSPLQLPDPVVQAVNCFGESNGRISLSPTGGTAPYQYTWSNGSSTAVNQNLRAGTYTVTVTDANGCTVNRSISVSEPTNIGLNLSITASPTCYGGSDGVLQSNVEGGSPAYTYAWSNGGTTAAISNLPANAYALTVTDAHGCLATASITTTQPTPVTVSYTISNDLDCIQNNVIITANASGGRGNYSYRLDGGALQSSGVFSGKTTGAYTLIAQDGAGCNSLPTSININEVLPLSLSYSLQNDQDCIAGNVNIIPIPSNAEGAVSYVIAPQGTFDFSTDLQQKGNGTYTLSGIDAKGCIASTTVSINEALPIKLSASIAGDTTDCIIGNVQVNLLSTGARGTVAYYFDALQSAETAPLQFSTGKLQRKIFAQDSSGCVDSVSLNIKDELFTNLLSGYNTIQDRDCISGNAGINLVLNPTFPSLPLSYQLNRTPAVAQPNFGGLSTGGYRIRVSYLACRDSVDVVIDERFPHITGFKYLHLDDCKPNNTGLKIQAEPGWGTLRYQVDNQAAQLSPVFDSLPVGSYRFQVQDSLNCVDSIRLVINTEGRAYISVEDLVQCDSASGSIAFRPNTQGIAAEYSIDGGKKWQSNPAFNALPPGIYHPLRRKPSTGCVEAALDSVVLGRHCDTVPLAYFLQKVIHISQPTELALIRWEAKAPKWYRDTFYLKMQMQGDGFPHFNDGNRANAQTPELRSAPPPGPNVYRYVGGGIHRDSVYLPLQDSAYLYTYPADYYFTLSNPLGKGAKVDPDRELTRVTVSLLDPETTPEGDEEVILCKDKDCVDIGKNDVQGANCYYWPDLANPGLKTQKVCKSGQYTRMALDENLKVIEKTVYTVKLSNLKVSIKPQLAAPLYCSNPLESFLEAIVSTEATKAITYLWNTGETTPKIHLNSSSIEYTVTVKQGDCSAQAKYTLPDNNPSCEIKAFFEQNGFFAIPISNLKKKSPPTFNSPELRTACPNPTGTVKDYARYTFDVNGGNVDPESQLKGALNSFETKFGYRDGTAIITSNDESCDCPDHLRQQLQNFNSTQGLSYWYHVFKKDETCPAAACDMLFIKAKMPNGKTYPASGQDLAFLGSGYEVAIQDVGLQGRTLLTALDDLCLDNFVAAKDPEMFELEPEEEEPEQVRELQVPCNQLGFHLEPVAVVAPTGQVMLAPKSSVWRFRRPGKEQFVDGALTGFTQVTITEGEESIAIRFEPGGIPILNPCTPWTGGIKLYRVKVGRRWIWGDRYEARTYANQPNQLEGYFQVMGIEDKAFRFEVPPSPSPLQPLKIYTGKLDKAASTNQCGLKYTIYSNQLIKDPPKGFSTQPKGTLIKTLAEAGLGIPKAEYTYRICREDLVKLASSINLNSKLGTLEVYMWKPSNSLNPGLYYKIEISGKKAYVFVMEDPGVGRRYFQFNCALGIWEEIVQPELNSILPKLAHLDALWVIFEQRGKVHAALELASFVPFIGNLASIANGVIYIREGQTGQGTWEIVIGTVGLGLDLLDVGTLMRVGRVGAKGEIIEAIAELPCPVAPPVRGPLVELRQSLACNVGIIFSQAAAKAFNDEIGTAVVGIASDILPKVEGLFNEFLKTDKGIPFLKWLNNNQGLIPDFTKIIANTFGKLNFSVADFAKLSDELIANPSLVSKLAGSSRNLEWWLKMLRAGKNASRLSAKVYEQIAKLPDGILNDLLYYTDDSFKEFMDIADDALIDELVANPDLVKGLVSHKNDAYLPYFESAVDYAESLVKTPEGAKLLEWLNYSGEMRVFLNRMAEARAFANNILKNLSTTLGTEVVSEVTFDVTTAAGTVVRTRLDGIMKINGKYIAVECKMGAAELSKNQKAFFEVLASGNGKITPVAGKASGIFGSDVGSDVLAKFAKYWYKNENLTPL